MGEQARDLDNLLKEIDTRLEEDALLALNGIQRHTVVSREPEEPETQQY